MTPGALPHTGRLRGKRQRPRIAAIDFLRLLLNQLWALKFPLNVTGTLMPDPLQVPEPLIVPETVLPFTAPLIVAVPVQLRSSSDSLIGTVSAKALPFKVVVTVTPSTVAVTVEPWMTMVIADEPLTGGRPGAVNVTEPEPV